MNEDDDLTWDEAEFLELFRQMPEEEQEVMVRVAQYLATRPEDGPKSMEEMEQLFEQFRRRN